MKNEHQFSPDKHEYQSSILYSHIRSALDSQDPTRIVEALQLLRTAIHGDSGVPMSELRQTQIEDYLNKGEELILYIGTGTNGERLVLRGRELWMNQKEDQQYSQKYYENFRRVFNLEPNTELRVEF